MNYYYYRLLLAWAGLRQSRRAVGHNANVLFYAYRVSLFVFTLWLSGLSAQAQAPPLLWQKALGGTANDEAYAITATADGGQVVAGYTNSNNGDVTDYRGNGDMWVVKLDASGNLLWQKTLGGTSFEGAYAITTTSDGGLVMAGYTNSNNGDVTGNQGGVDYWVVKLDAQGNLLWQKTLGGTGNEVANAIAATSDGGLVVAGYTLSNDGDVTGNRGGRDFWVVRLDAMGNLLWQKTLGGSSDDQGYGITTTADGGLVVAGGTLSNNGDVTGNRGGYDFWVVKLDAMGSLLWQKTLGGTSYDAAYAIKATGDGGVVVAGTTNSNNGDVTGNRGVSDFWVVRLDVQGTLLWQKTLGGTGSDDAYGLTTTGDGGIVVTGFTDSTDGDVTGIRGGYDYWVVKLDAMGSLLWQKALGGTVYDDPRAITATADGGLVVAGSADSNDGDVTGNHGRADFWVVKLLAAPPCGPVVYVTPAGAGLLDGSSWANAFAGMALQTAINTAAGCGAQVWVAQGTYKPTTGSDRNISFAMREGVAIYGGFVGSEATLTERNPASYTTVLSGNISDAGTSADNSYHVINNPSGLTQAAVLDGVVITAGNANGPNSSTTSAGGGMYNLGSSPSLLNCSFIANSASYNGGGMYNLRSSPRLFNCSFIANSSSRGNGGGMVSQNSSPGLINCSFQANSASSAGGGILISDSGLSLLNCSFQANVAANGGGVYNSSSSASMTNCVVFGNGGSNSITGGLVTARSSLFEVGVTGYSPDPTNLTTTTSPFVSATDLRLKPCSPAINAGDNTAYTTANGPATDLAGNPRLFNGGVIDMGAYEYQGDPVTVTVSNPAVSTATVGQAFSQAFTATGGAEPYSFSVVSSNLPASLSLSTAGVLSGTPTQVGSYTVLVQASDANGCVGLASTAYSLTVQPLALNASFTATPTMLLTTGSTSLSAVVTGGTSPYTYVFSGPGVITPSGNTASVSGLSSGVQTFTLTATDATAPTNQTVTGTLSVTVSEPVPDGPICDTYTTRTTANGLGANVRGVYAVGSTVYAATGSGLSISTDGGSSFTNKTTANGLGNNFVNGVYAVGSTVYAATSGGLSISTDGGSSFTNRNTTNGLGSITVRGVYAQGTMVYVATTNGLGISTDGGSSFTNRNTTNGLGSNNVNGVYAVGSVVYAATGNGLSISTDGGSSFTNRTTASGLGNNTVLGVYAQGSTVYAATNGGLSISTDGGSSFTNKTTANGLGNNTVYSVYALGSVVYAATNGGLGISTDGGSSFTNKTTANGLGNNNVIGVYAVGSRIYAATGNGLSFCPAPSAPLVLSSFTASPTSLLTTGSTSLSAVVTGGTSPYTYVFSGPGVITPSGNTASVSGLSAGVQTFTLTATDATAPTNQTVTGTVSVTVSEPVPDGPVCDTYTNRTTANGLGSNVVRGIYEVGSVIYAATTSGLGISTDRGSSFTNKTTANGLGGDNVGVVYALGSTVYATTGGGLSISTDGGTSFTNRTTANGLGDNQVSSVYVVGSVVYAATLGGVSISTDGGNSFTNRTTANGLGSNTVNSVYAVGSVVYAATGGGGLSISTDGGSSFTTRTTVNGLGNTIVFGVYAVGSVVYAATQGGLSISTDGGTSFTNRTTANGLGSNTVFGVYVLGSTVYAATNNGLSISTDGGSSFINRTTDNGLGNTIVIGVYALGSRIYAATFGGLSFCPAPPAPLVLSSVTASPATLLTTGSTSLSAVVTGGTGPYSYVFSGPGVITPSGNTASVSGLSAGVQTFTLTATDATAPTNQTVTGTVSVTVSQANTAPTLANAIPPQSATVGQGFSYVIPANTFTDTETPASLTLTVAGLPDWLNFTAPATLSGTPSTTVGSPFSVTVTATDPGNLAISTIFAISVQPAPVMATPLFLSSFTASPATLLTTGSTSLSAVVSGGTGPYSYVFSGPGVITPSGNTASVSGLSAGVQTFTLTATDATAPTNQTVTGTVSVMVSEANTPPTVANLIPPQSATVGQGFSYVIPANTFTDTETPASLTLTVAGLPAGLSFTAPATLSGTPSTTVGSPFSVTVTATDPGNLSVSTVFTITVQPATVVSAPFAITAVTTINCTPVLPNRFSISFTPRYSGLNGQPVSFSVANELLPTNEPGPYTLQLYSDNPIITLQAIQSGNPPGQTTFSYNWLEACRASESTNTTPRLVTVIPPQSATVGVGFSYVIPAGTFTDDQTPGSLQLAATGLPAGLTVSGYTLSGVPSTTVGSPYTVSITATDPGGLSVSTSFVLTVSPGPVSPPVDPTQPFSITGVSLLFCTPVADRININFTPRYAGVNGQAISFAVVNELAPTNEPGPYSLTLYRDNPTIVLKATQTGSVDQASFAYNWLAACASMGTDNTPPRINSSVSNQTATVGQGFSLNLSSTFADQETPNSLTLTVMGLPDGLALVGTNITGTPSVSGVSTVLLKATDPGSLSTSTSFVLTVSPASSTTVSPSDVFSITGVQTVSCEVLSAGERKLTFTPQYAGLTGQPISFSVVNELLPTTAAGPYSLNLYTDNPTITLKATQSGSAGEASFSYNWLAVCNAPARLGVGDVGIGLQVRILGNPVDGSSAEIEISGVVGQQVQIDLVDMQGQPYHQQTLSHADRVDRVSLPIGNRRGVLLIRVSSLSQQVTMKLIRL